MGNFIPSRMYNPYLGIIYAIYVCFYMDKDIRRANRYAKREQVMFIQHENPNMNKSIIIVDPPQTAQCLYPPVNV
uniref:Uncharacterized protein n=1 Tax=Acrobeloides nanus TaxID=290746 RepID=A0A914E7E9_9BILA